MKRWLQTLAAVSVIGVAGCGNAPSASDPAASNPRVAEVRRTGEDARGDGHNGRTYSRNGGRATPGTPSTSGAAASAVTSGPASGAALGLALKAGCAQPVAPSEYPLEPGEPRPESIANCTLGESKISVRAYTGARDVETYLHAMSRYSGVRLVGPTWVVVVDTPEAAQRLRPRLGGRIVELGR